MLRIFICLILVLSAFSQAAQNQQQEQQNQNQQQGQQNQHQFTRGDFSLQTFSLVGKWNVIDTDCEDLKEQCRPNINIINDTNDPTKGILIEYLYPAIPECSNFKNFTVPEVPILGRFKDQNKSSPIFNADAVLRLNNMTIQIFRNKNVSNQQTESIRNQSQTSMNQNSNQQNLNQQNQSELNNTQNNQGNVMQNQTQASGNIQESSGNQSRQGNFSINQQFESRQRNRDGQCFEVWGRQDSLNRANQTNQEVRNLTNKWRLAQFIQANASGNNLACCFPDGDVIVKQDEKTQKLLGAWRFADCEACQAHRNEVIVMDDLKVWFSDNEDDVLLYPMDNENVISTDGKCAGLFIRAPKVSCADMERNLINVQNATLNEQCMNLQNRNQPQIQQGGNQPQMQPQAGGNQGNQTQMQQQPAGNQTGNQAGNQGNQTQNQEQPTGQPLPPNPPQAPQPPQPVQGGQPGGQAGGQP